MILHFLLATANASSFNIPPFSEFTREANTIVRGTLSSIHAENAINDAGTKMIFTYAALDVKDVIKGSPAKNPIQIRKIGGTKDGMSLEIPGSPEFVNGEENVFFLSAQKADQSYEVESLELGQYGVHENNGQTELTGGIFNYNKHDEHNAGTEHAENQRVWTISELRKVVAEQKLKASPTSAPLSSVSPQNSTPQTPTPVGTQVSGSEKYPAHTPTDSTQSEGEPSSFGKISIFVVIGLILLGLIFFFRKR